LPENFKYLYPVFFVINSHCEKFHSANVQLFKLLLQENDNFFFNTQLVEQRNRGTEEWGKWIFEIFYLLCGTFSGFGY